VKKVIFATKNKGKLREVKNIFEGSPFEILSLLDFENVPEIIENGDTFEENALLKAKTVYEYFKIPAFGDDSGLAVDQLGGAPGVISARYAGEDADDKENNEKLLNELNKYPEPHKAKFICAAVFYDGEKKMDAYGEVRGRIIKDERGSNGFGYDPLFIPEGYDVTMGQLEIEEKNKISHRSHAFKKLRNLLEQSSEKQ